MSQPIARAKKSAQPLTMRRLLLPIHRWIGMTLGLVVLASAITGAGMAFRKELDPVVYAGLLKAPACASRLPLDAFVSRARLLRPREKLDYIRLLDRADAPVILRFADKETLYFAPCSGVLLGHQNRYEGFFGRLEQLHRFAYVKNGGWLMGAGALSALFVMAVGGVLIWWPRAPRRFADGLRLNTRLKGAAFELDLHRTLGAWAAIMIAVSATTGLPNAFDNVRDALNIFSGTKETPPPKSAPPPGAKPARITMEQAWRTAQAFSPHPREALLHLAPKARSPVEIFLIGADAPHANARTYVYLDAYSGRVLRYAPYARMGLGQKIYYWSLSLHTGELGGIWGQFLLFFGAASVPVLAWTGIGAWLRRRVHAGKVRPQTARATQRRTVSVVRVEPVSPGVSLFELAAADGRPLPPASPGAHIDVVAAPGLVRQYSLINGPDENDRYLIAVRRDPASRGGSRAMHDTVSQGDSLKIGEPRNHFPLSTSATSHLLLARGIGITPILAMARKLAHDGAEFRVVHFTRSPDHSPFRTQLTGAELAAHAEFHHGLDPDAEDAVIEALVATRPPGAHLYVCGGARFMESVERASAPAWPPEAVHREYFNANPDAWSAERRPVRVTLARRGITLDVPAELTVLEAIQKAGVTVETSCQQGVCGTCLTRVLAGTPDHRDAVLSSAERARNDRMLICVSRGASAELTLDL